MTNIKNKFITPNTFANCEDFCSKHQLFFINKGHYKAPDFACLRCANEEEDRALAEEREATVKSRTLLGLMRE